MLTVHCGLFTMVVHGFNTKVFFISRGLCMGVTCPLLSVHCCLFINDSSDGFPKGFLFSICWLFYRGYFCPLLSGQCCIQCSDVLPGVFPLYIVVVLPSFILVNFLWRK